MTWKDHTSIERNTASALRQAEPLVDVVAREEFERGRQSVVSLQAAFQQVVDIMQSTEDVGAIREIIRQAGIVPGIYVGDDPESFQDNPVKATEYILGQWAHGIDSDTPYLNTFRNITLSWIDKGTLLPITKR